MKRLSLFAIAYLAAGGLGCDAAREADKDALGAAGEVEDRTPAAEAETQVSEEMTEFRRESKVALDAMNRKLQRLERSVEYGSAEAKIEAQEELRELRSERDELAKTVDGAEAKSKAELTETERNIDHRLAELGKHINRALDRAGDTTEEALE